MINVQKELLSSSGAFSFHHSIPSLLESSSHHVRFAVDSLPEADYPENTPPIFLIFIRIYTFVRRTAMKSWLPVFCICFVLLLPVGLSHARHADPGQSQNRALFLWPQTDSTAAKDSELAGVYREADESLVHLVRDRLASRDVSVTAVKSEQETAADPARFLLLVKIEKIELGGRRPFGRTAKVNVSYTFQNKNRFSLVKRTVEETSVQKWQNCINKISEQIVSDTDGDLAKYSAAMAEEKQGKSK